MYGKLLKQNSTGKMRIYFCEGQERPYELWVNSLWHGDPVYSYKTYKGACIAMAKFEKGRYKGKPSTKWE